ncbi:MAG: hypothetical protein BAJALOKI1v1_630018 [Promethearchaeota archaeon]|nr:MAG: hypothetical protein BAJALOKI1v1_630018 [Candidatus Lokiarchaeota archaeon]
MTVNSNGNRQLFCPFTDRCDLPQVETICRFPECKVCPEYQQKLKAMKK